MSSDFASYDFDGDARWNEYRSKVELVGDEEAQLQRLKARWYRKNVDPEFVDVATTAAKASEAPDASSASNKVPEPEEPAPQPSQQNTAPADAGSAKPSMEVVAIFSAVLHLAVLAFGAAFLVSFVLRMSRYNLLFYRLFLQAVLASCIVRLYSTVGMPQLRPFDLQRLSMWLARLVGTSDFHYAMVSFMFTSQRPVALVIIGPSILMGMRLASFIVRKLYQAAKIAVPPSQWVLERRETLFLLSAFSDLSVLWSLLIMVFTGQIYMLPFVYLNMMKSRYNSPASARYHQRAWGYIDSLVSPYLNKLPQPVQKVVGFVTGWFTTPNALGQHAATA